MQGLRRIAEAVKAEFDERRAEMEIGDVAVTLSIFAATLVLSGRWPDEDCHPDRRPLVNIECNDGIRSRCRLPPLASEQSRCFSTMRGRPTEMRRHRTIKSWEPECVARHRGGSKDKEALLRERERRSYWPLRPSPTQRTELCGLLSPTSLSAGSNRHCCHLEGALRALNTALTLLPTDHTFWRVG